MMIEWRSIFDTNVVVSASLLPRSVPRQAFDKARAHGKLLISVPTIEELHEVLRRPRFDKYITEEKRMEFLAAFVREAELVEITEVVTVCRDADDNRFLELAVSGRATHVVSGDQDLLVLNPFRGIPVLTPKAFLSLS